MVYILQCGLFVILGVYLRDMARRTGHPTSRLLTRDSANVRPSTNRHVALKILTADSYGSTRDTFELSILEHIKAKGFSNPGASHVLGLLDHFRHQGPNGGHVCLVFKAMGPDLVTYRRLFPRRRIPIPLLKQITRRLSLAFAHLHQTCGIIHTGKFKPLERISKTQGADTILVRHQTTKYPHRNNRDQ